MIENGNRTLRIANTTVDESKSYTCYAKNDLGEAKMQFELNVLQPPTYVPGVNKGALSGSDRFKTKLAAQFDELVLMKCPITGIPQPDIYWTEEMQDGANAGKMTILSNEPIFVRNRE